MSVTCEVSAHTSMPTLSDGMKMGCRKINFL
jgi:hypothetical protein